MMARLDYKRKREVDNHGYVIVLEDELLGPFFGLIVHNSGCLGLWVDQRRNQGGVGKM